MPGTVAQLASYASQTGLLGLTHEYRFSEHWRTTATVYGRSTHVATPYLVDWERDAILGGGGRAALYYRDTVAGRPARRYALLATTRRTCRPQYGPLSVTFRPATRVRS